MKLLNFPVASAALDLFNLAYVGLNNPEARLTPAELRTHGKILDKFEAIAVAVEGAGFKLPEGSPGTVLLEDAELALMKKLCESMPWLPAASRRVVQLFDMIDQAPVHIPAAPAPIAAPTPVPEHTDTPAI